MNFDCLSKQTHNKKINAEKATIMKARGLYCQIPLMEAGTSE
jgi:hypothetical protein